MMGFGYSTGGMIASVVSWLVLILIAILVIRWATRAGHGKRMMHGMMGDDAVKILRERYAKGEINKEEFEARKKDLDMMNK